jgi:DNA-binding NarL/FixJ family response regulator
VLLGNLEPMVRLGMTEVLTDGGVEVLPQHGAPEGIVAEAERLLPDAVVLGLEGDGSRWLRERLLAVAPAAKVILWARDEHAMEVWEAGKATPRHVLAAGQEALLRELNEQQPSQGRE